MINNNNKLPSQSIFYTQRAIKLFWRKISLVKQKIASVIFIWRRIRNDLQYFQRRDGWRREDKISTSTSQKSFTRAAGLRKCPSQPIHLFPVYDLPTAADVDGEPFRYLTQSLCSVVGKGSSSSLSALGIPIWIILISINLVVNQTHNLLATTRRLHEAMNLLWTRFPFLSDSSSILWVLPEAEGWNPFFKRSWVVKGPQRQLICIFLNKKLLGFWQSFCSLKENVKRRALVSPWLWRWQAAYYVDDSFPGGGAWDKVLFVILCMYLVEIFRNTLLTPPQHIKKCQNHSGLLYVPLGKYATVRVLKQHCLNRSWAWCGMEN